MHIAINSRHGHNYATVMQSVREGDRVVREKHIYLGKVLNRQLGIFSSKERGIFQGPSIIQILKAVSKF